METRELESNIAKNFFEVVKRDQGILVEYSNVHKIGCDARVVASTIKLQVRELSQDLQNQKLESKQLEWLCDSLLILLDFLCFFYFILKLFNIKSSYCSS